MNQQGQVVIPEFVILGCPNCGKKAVAEMGAKMVCQSCVNDFLARNVGLMVPVKEEIIDAGEEEKATD